MPTRKAPILGLLISPRGDKVEPLIEDEYLDLDTYLAMKRSESGFDAVLSFLLHLFRQSPAASDEEVFRQLIGSYLADHSDNSDGILSNRFGKVTILQHPEENEYENLQNTLTALRAGGWFAEWIKARVHRVATAKSRWGRYPSPYSIAGSLMASIAEYEAEVDNLRKVMEHRPDIFDGKYTDTESEGAPVTEATTLKAEKLPEWTMETPEEVLQPTEDDNPKYRLRMDDPTPTGDTFECIDMSREEYIHLKRQLANTRGYTIPEEGS